MRVRSLEAADVPAVAALFTETVRSVNARDHTPEQVEAWAPRPPDVAAWERSFEGRTALVAEVDGEVAGFGDLAAGGYLDRLYVHRDHQGRGVATALAGALEAEAARSGASEVTADASNHGAAVLRKARVRDGRPPGEAAARRALHQLPGSQAAGRIPPGGIMTVVHGYTRDKEEVRRRLRRIAGQVRGLEKMIDEDRYCIDVLTQVSAVKAALESVALLVLEDHVDHCVADAIRAGDATEKVVELTSAIERLVRS